MSTGTKIAWLEVVAHVDSGPADKGRWVKELWVLSSMEDLFFINHDTHYFDMI